MRQFISTNKTRSTAPNNSPLRHYTFHKAAEAEAQELAHSFVNTDSQDISTAKGSGSMGKGRSFSQPLRASFERRFGFDFSQVRIYDDPAAARDAREAGAAAFTRDSSLVFAAGTYDPSSVRGRELLAHELVHVAQQGLAQPLIGIISPVRVRAPAGELYCDRMVNYQRLAAEIHDAMNLWGTDEEAVYRALQRLGRDPDAIRQLEAVYLDNYKESLEDALRDDFSGEELEYVLQLLGRRTDSTSARRIEGMSPMTPEGMIRAAQRLRDAVKDWGTDEEAIFAVLLPFERNHDQLNQLKQAYENLPGVDETLEQTLENELSGNERDYAFYLLGGAPMRARLEVQIIPEAEAVRLFRELAELNFWTSDNREAPLPFHYPPDGCYFRAQAMTERMTELGYASQKVFAITSPRSLRVRNSPFGEDVSEGEEPEVEWAWHVAPIVRVQTASGVVDMVMDPALESGPIPLNRWLGRMNPGAFNRMSIEEMRNWYRGWVRPPVRGVVTAGRNIYMPSASTSSGEGAHRAMEAHRPLVTWYSRFAVLHEIASVIRSELANPDPDVNPILRAIRIAPRSPAPNYRHWPARNYPARRDLWEKFPELREQLRARLNAADMAAVEAAVSTP